MKLLPRRVQEVHHGDQEAGQGGEVGLDVGVAEGQICQADEDKSTDLVTSFPLAQVFNLLMELTLALQQQSQTD